MTRRRVLTARAILLLGALAARAARADGEASIAVRATPATLVLGSDSAAAIEIDAPDGRAPEVTASAGRVENLRPVGGGRFAADYFPPREAYPRVAIVAAVAGSRCGWTPIPLVGHGLAVARSAPRSPIRVTIGAAVFGPVIADAGGEARVPVVVPPGVRVAYQHGKPLDLKIPESAHVHLALGAADAPADVAHEVAIWAFAVTPEGVPRAGAPLQVEATVGEVGPLAEIAPGTFAGTWRLAPGRAAEAAVTARLADEPGALARSSIVRHAGALARLRVESGRARAVAGDGIPVPLLVTATDAAGNPVAADLRLAASLGTLSAPVDAGPGSWHAELDIPRELGATRRAEVVARAGAVEHRIDVEVSPAVPVRLLVAPAVSTLVADGDAELNVHVRLLDRFGNDVAEPAPRAETTGIAAVSSDADPAGGWIVRYRPARVRESGSDVLTLRAAALEGTTRIELVAPERRIAVGAKVGFAASPAGLRSAYGGVEGAYRPGFLAGRLRPALEIATFVHDRTDEVSAGDASFSVHGRARYVTLVASAQWHETLGAQYRAWGSLGTGMSHVESDVSVAGHPASGESAVVATLQGSIAFGRKLGHGTPFAELRVGWHSDPRLEALRGALTAFTLCVGWVHDAY